MRLSRCCQKKEEKGSAPNALVHGKKEKKKKKEEGPAKGHEGWKHLFEERKRKSKGR